MPERETINTKLLEILTELSFNDELTAYQSELNLKDDLGLDSLSLVNLVMELNNVFNISVKSIEIIPENFATVGALADFIERKINE